MKLSTNSYPFAVYAETKKSKKTGKDFLAVSVKHNFKDANGQKAGTFFNLLDSRDLLVLANLCQKAYFAIEQTRTLERFGDKAKEEGKQEATKDEEPKGEEIFDDEVPF